MNYTVDYFIQKFEAIPESEWCTNSLHNEYGQRCALGHCLGYAGEVTALNHLMSRTHFRLIHHVNNGDDPDYQQPTPKQRVLAALYDIKAKEINITEVHEVPEHQTVNL